MASHLDRFMTENRPCRFCAIAVTLATRTCVRLRARWVGGLSSATLKSPSAALSLSCSTMIFYQISTAHEPAVVYRVFCEIWCGRYIVIHSAHRQSQYQEKGHMNLLSPVEGEMAVRLARGAIDYTLGKKPKPLLALTPVFGEKRGVFVTLTKAGHLRGCIGFPYPVMPLGDAIEDAAVAAATGDPRFPSVRKDELAIHPA